jgi:hypothetical protein
MFFMSDYGYDHFKAGRCEAFASSSRNQIEEKDGLNQMYTY